MSVVLKWSGCGLYLGLNLGNYFILALQLALLVVDYRNKDTKLTRVKLGTVGFRLNY